MKKNTFLSIFAFFSIFNIHSQVFTPTNVEVNRNLLPVTVPNSSLTSPGTLNTFFATKLGTYLSEASDLSASKAYAVLDNADGRLFIGGTFNSHTTLRDFTRLLFTGGMKLNVKDGFANIFNSEGFNNDIGLSFKTSFLGSGKIWFDKNAASQKNKVIAKRRYLRDKLLAEMDNNVSNEKNSIASFSPNEQAAALADFIQEQDESTRDKFSEEEAKYISKNKLFNIAHSWWVSGDIYVPVTKSSYDVSPTLNNLNVTASEYRPFELNIAYTNFWEKNKWSKIPIKNLLLWKGTTILTVKGSLIANNSVLAELIEGYDYEKYLRQSTVIDTFFLAKLKTKTVYVGDFERFITPRLSGRFVYMPFSFIGISAAVEKNFGKLDALNWRLGIPVSLKDNEGKAKVNFEVVWREVQKAHSFGISIGLPIGKNIF